MRLDSFLVKAKIASKKDAKKLIRKKQILVNNEVCNLPAYQLLANDKVSYQGNIIPPPKDNYYYMFNKPKGILMDRDFDNEYRNFQEYILNLQANNQLKPAGRLSLDSEGLIILTTDGELIHRLTHPKYNIDKEYIITSKEELKDEEILAIQSGFKLYDGTITEPINIEKIDNKKYKISYSYHYPHLIKKIFKTFGNWVETQKRVKIGNLLLDESLGVGDSRELKENELNELFLLVNLK